jgi:hypothetical protein
MWRETIAECRVARKVREELMRGHDRGIVMDRAITRRDVLNGVGVGLTSALASRSSDFVSRLQKSAG